MTTASKLRVALVGGPMYDHLYRVFEPDEVEVVIHADHPTLNRRVADALASGERIDLLATHSKYAPSQVPWLTPLDDLIAPEAVGALAPRAVDLCTFEGTRWCLPRLIDVRVLWARSDRLASVPDTWNDLLTSDAVLGFTGRESGAFGMFFELVVGAGGRLFDDELEPTLDSPECIEAIATMCELGRRAPADLPGWHYDEVDTALLDGRVDLAAAWPGGWGPIRDSALAEVLTPHLYPAGPQGRFSYSGCHAWAIPRTCGNVEGAVALLERLLGEEAQSVDAAGGSVCAHLGAFAKVTPESAIDARRLEVIRATIDGCMITYPSLARFPEVEDAGWHALTAALSGELTPADAASAMQRTARAVLG